MNYEIKFLDDFDLIELHEALLEAFSDYLIPMKPTREQFQEMLIRRGAKKEFSVAAFEGNRIVGFNLNGFETYQETPTVYDVATGIIPEARKQGLASRLFDFSMPRLKSTGANRYVLEVFENNSPAVRLYQKVGFIPIRKLLAFTTIPTASPEGNTSYTITHLKEPDWPLFQSFWSWQPSWQNSIKSMDRAQAQKVIAAVHQDSKIIGYGILFPDSGDLPQIAVHPAHRKHGVGQALLQHMLSRVSPEKSVRIVNVDESAKEDIRFLTNRGFTLLITQFEMEMRFS